MMLREGRVRLLVLGAAAFVMLVGAADPLRPLVMRTEQPRGAAPAECEEGLSPSTPLRVDVREIPLPEEIAPPPTTVAAPPQGELRGALESVQNALVRNNRPAFDEALVRMRLIVERYPSGGERRSAEELIRIYETAGRLWEAQYQSPFIAQESAEYTAVSAYPGYQEAVRRSVLTDRSGRKFYPAAESREFLTRVAADRLNRLGVRTSTPPARVSRAEVTPATASPRRSVAASSSSSSSPSRRSATTPTSRPRTSRSSQARKPAATTPAPSKPNPSAPPTVATVPAPAAPRVAPPAAGHPPPAVTSDPVVVTDSTPAAPATTEPTETTDTAATATTTTAPPLTPPPAAPEPATTEPARGRSVILPTILILIGLGVLIVLFRASK